MQPQCPVTGPSIEEGFALPLFETCGLPILYQLEIEFVQEPEELSPRPIDTCASESDCACE